MKEDCGKVYSNNKSLSKHQRLKGHKKERERCKLHNNKKGKGLILDENKKCKKCRYLEKQQSKNKS